MTEEASDKTFKSWSDKLPTELQLEVSNLLAPKDAAVLKVSGLAVDPKREQSASWSCARVWGSILNPNLSSEAIFKLLSKKHNYPVVDIILVGQDLHYLYHNEKLSRPLYLHLQMICSQKRLPGGVDPYCPAEDSDNWLEALRKGWWIQDCGNDAITRLINGNIVLLIDRAAPMEDLLSLGMYETLGLRYQGGNELQTLRLRWQLFLPPQLYNHPLSKKKIPSSKKINGPDWELEIFPTEWDTFPAYRIRGQPPRNAEAYSDYIESFVIEAYNSFLDSTPPDDRYALLWRMEDGLLYE